MREDKEMKKSSSRERERESWLKKILNQVTYIFEEIRRWRKGDPLASLFASETDILGKEEKIFKRWKRE